MSNIILSIDWCALVRGALRGGGDEHYGWMAGGLGWDYWFAKVIDPPLDVFTIDKQMGNPLEDTGLDWSHCVRTTPHNTNVLKHIRGEYEVIHIDSSCDLFKDQGRAHGWLRDLALKRTVKEVHLFYPPRLGYSEVDAYQPPLNDFGGKVSVNIWSPGALKPWKGKNIRYLLIDRSDDRCPPWLDAEFDKMLGPHLSVIDKPAIRPFDLNFAEKLRSWKQKVP